MTISFKPLTLAGIAALALAGCNNATSDTDTATADASAPTLPISMNAVMVSVVDSSADYIFALGNGDLPRDDHDWDTVRSATYEMILAGEVTKLEGTGGFDAEWVADAGWQQMAQDLSTIGQEALALAEAKSDDVDAWRALADRLIDNCESCHQQFKPDVPSQGILHEGTERESRGESIFD
jgi:cytochrome c556